MITNSHTAAARRTPTRRWRWIVAAAGVVALVVGLALLVSDDSPTEPTATPPSDETSFAADNALSVADEYFELYNAGDAASVLALFAPDATYSDRWGDGPDDAEEYTFEFFEMLLEWNVAGGTQLIDPTCSHTGQRVPPSSRPGSTNDEMTVECQFGDHQVRTQVAGRDPVPITLTLVISADGIHEWNRVIGRPNFAHCCEDFEDWVVTFHRNELAAFEYGIWTSAGEARASGELTARFADEWAAHTSRGTSDSSPRMCKSPCSAAQPDDSADPSLPPTTLPG